MQDTSSSNRNANTLPAGGGGGGHRSNPVSSYTHRSLFQNLLKDKIDWSNISNDLKSTIMDQSTAKLSIYDGSKYSTRCETKASILDAKQVMAVKKKRIEAVYNEGFLSDPKELYRPLGQVIIDTKDLLYQGLQLEIDQRENNETEADKEATLQKKEKLQMKMKFREVPKRHNNGFKFFQEKIQESNARIGSVKFGAAFESVVTHDDRPHVYDKVDEVAERNRHIDWNNLEIDEDRRTYFLGNYTKYMNTHKGNNFSTTTQNAERSTASTPLPNDKSALKPSFTRSYKPKNENQAVKVIYSSKQIETVLGIKRNGNTTETTEKFFTTRDDFYEQRTRLNYQLSEDLERMDYTRKTTFDRKVKSFQLSKAGNRLEDMKSMRDHTLHEAKVAAKTIIENHPWYTELITKVVVLNGSRQVTSHENVILSQIKKLIQDQAKFTKQVFLQLIRLLPTKDFLKDEVQRIIRFVKAHESISERDFLDIVEAAGHGLGPR